MSAPHWVKPGLLPGCEHPEDRRGGFHYNTAACRGCMTAAVAAAVNAPTAYAFIDEKFRRAPDAALQRVRQYLDETDPLRVRAEQALVPLCAETVA